MNYLNNSVLQTTKKVSPMEKSTDYSNYWLTPAQIEDLKQDSKEASLYYAGKFSKILEQKLSQSRPSDFGR